MSRLPHRAKDIFIFLVPSFIGVWAFLVPFSFAGEVNTLIGHVKEFLMMKFLAELGLIAAALCLAVVILSFLAVLLRPKWISRSHILRENLLTGPFWLATRFCSLPIAMLAVWGDPEIFGRFMQYAGSIVIHIVPRLIMLSVVLSLTAPLLLDFGLVQFIAVFAGPVMRPLFKVPGRSAVDCIASWLGSSSMAVVFTAKMHLHGYYTDREAAVVVTNFSLAGIYNIYAITALLYMTHLFTHILLSVYASMFIIAVITPRIWPLCTIPDTYLRRADGIEEAPPDERCGDQTLFKKAMTRGMGRAKCMSIPMYFRESLSIALPLLFGTVPLVITFGTLLVTFVESTHIMRFIAAPFSWMISILGFKEAEMIANAAVVSFIDQYLAVAYGQRLYSESARFLCICLSMAGLINMTELGIHIWHSRIPLNLWHMVVIYIMRIILSLFILIPIAHIMF